METNAEHGRAEFLWVETNETAAAQLRAGRMVSAAETWRHALEITRQFEENDPRRASSLSNLAVSHRITGELPEAEHCCRRAVEAWETASTWVDAMAVSTRARSSLFHLRMERRHKRRYDRIAADRHEKLLTAAAAGTLNNLAELLHAAARPDEAEPLYRKALAARMAALGDAERGAAIIRSNIACLPKVDPQPDEPIHPDPGQAETAGLFSAQAARRRWIIDRPAEFTDEGRLMAALLLTQLVEHRRLMGSAASRA